VSFREPNGAVMTANMKPQGGRSIEAPSLRGLQSRSATGQNGQAAKEKMSWRAGCSENISGFRLREMCFLLDIPFYRTSGIRHCDGDVLGCSSSSAQSCETNIFSSPKD
jgi:hypothetical protein